MAEGSRGAIRRDGLVSVAQAAPPSKVNPTTSDNRGMSDLPVCFARIQHATRAAACPGAYPHARMRQGVQTHGTSGRRRAFGHHHLPDRPMTIEIRQCTADDAEAIASLATEFQSYLHELGDETDFDWGAAKYLADGFGETPAFEGLVAEVDSRVVGYALYHFGYDTDRGQRLIYLIDLFVSQLCRRAGIGDKLMQC